jgi:hypothetical protein
MAAKTATCRTDGCEANGVPITVEVPTTDPAGNPATVPVFCGACSQVIEDVTDPI